MADTDALDTMEHLVAALRKHIAQEEEERRRNPVAWLATLEATTQQQWALQACLRHQRETREEQAPATPCPADDRGSVLEAHPLPPALHPSHGVHTALPAHGAPQDAARSSRAHEEEASDSPQHGSQDRLEALEASLRLLHTKVDALLRHLERQAQEA